MPMYPYRCHDCGERFDVAKFVSDIDLDEQCSCGSHDTERYIALSSLEKSSMVQPYFEPALGCIINSNGHKKRILKKRGMEEIGNTSPETMYKDFEMQREKRIERTWDEL